VSKPVPTLVVGGSEDEPLVLSGPPTDLTGRIELHNPSDAKVVLRDAGLRDPSGVLTLPTARAAVQPLVLRPDQGGTLPLAVAVDPATPPGEYSAEIEVGGRSRPVVLRVAEVFDLRVEPRRLVVLNRPGVAQTKRLVVTNEGNVPFTLGDPVTVDLRRDPPRERTLRVALEPFLRTEEPELKDLVVAMLAIAREEERLGELQVRGERQVEVRPGETTALDVEITLYDELPPTRRYRGVLPVLTRDVDVVVVPSRGPEPAEKTPQRRRRTTTTTKRPPPKRGATA
jgi:hypothetical protein